MTNDKILEIARCYGVQSRYIDCIAFTEKEIIAFAQSILEAEWEKRKPLTDEEIDDCIASTNEQYREDPPVIWITRFARAVERRINGDEE